MCRQPSSYKCAFVGMMECDKIVCINHTQTHNMKITKKAPETLTQLLQATTLALWRGKSCERQFYSNVLQAIALLGDDLEVTTHQVAQLKRYYESKGLKPATVNQKLVNLHSCLLYGNENGWLSAIPKFSFDKIDNENSRLRLLSAIEEKALFDWLRTNDEQMAGFCELLLLTGCRCGELLAATQVNIDGNWLRLYETKSGKGRRIPLTPRAKELADALIPFKHSYADVYACWNRAKKACGLGEDTSLVLHSLRHTSATRLLKKCANIKVVKEFLGHASLKTTERYAKLHDDDLMAAVMM
jgi:integrase